MWSLGRRAVLEARQRSPGRGGNIAAPEDKREALGLRSKSCFDGTGMINQKRLKQILKEYQSRLRELLGDDLASIVLYGSQARGDAEEGSDIDVLCVMKKTFDYGELILRTSEITAELSLKYNVVLSRSFASLEDYKTRQTPFLMNVRREGVAV